MTLYQMSEQWNAVIQMLDDPEVPDEVVFDTIDLIESSMDDKADGYAKIIRNLTAEAAEAKAESDRLRDRANAMKKTAESLKKRLEDAMKETGRTQIKTALFSFSIQKNPVSVEVLSLSDALNSGYLKPPKMDEDLLDKTAMKKDLQAGIEIPGVRLTQTSSLRIR